MSAPPQPQSQRSRLPAPATSPDPTEYHIGIICTLSYESIAICSFFDERFDLRTIRMESKDENTYHLGRMGDYYVALAQLPSSGKSAAASTVTHMSRTFKNIRLVFLLGIGGGVPSRRNPVHLGDVVVGITHDARGAVFEYDRGKERQSNTFEHTSSLNSPPVFAINIVRAIEVDLTLDPEQLDWKINEGLDNIPQRIRRNFSRPQSNPDNLYESLFTHPQQGEPNHCGELCSLSRVVLWHARQPEEIMATTHLGLIASGDRVIKDAIFRDKMAEKNVLCMEMEAAGVMNNAPCLVIRGISDYCDTHKNDQWHGYAAMSAAAYARMVLDKLHPSTIQAQDRLNQLLVSVRDIQINLTKNENRAASRDILEWLSKIIGVGINMENTHINYINERTAGTGKWFLSKPEFKEWVTSKGKAIYCEGLPGTGKTIIASLVIEELKRGTFSDGQKFGLAYFYCSLSRSAASETYVFLACLLKQLITQTEGLPDCVRNLYENQSADVDSLKEALVVILQGFPMSFIVVDALDEWEQEVRYRMPIIEELFDLRKRAKVNIFLTSRNIQYITDNLLNWSESQLVEISATETDMSLFLQMELSASKLLCASITRLNDLGNKCIDCVVKHSKGMFLLTWLRAKDLVRRNTVAEIEKSLQIIENEKDAESCLAEAYDNAIKRIDEAKSLPLATQLFQWIIYARRPMTMSEIHHALAIKMGDTSFQWKNAVDEATILSKDAGLVREGQDGTLSLNHIKTRRYLENKELIATPIAEADITIACTTYLSFQSFENGPCISRLQVDQRTTSHPFYLYASRYWGSHARTWLQHYGTASDNSGNSEIGKKRGELYSVLKRFLLRTPCVQASIQGYEQSRDIRQGSLNKQKRLIRWEDPSDPPRGERKRQAKGKHKVRTQGETFGFHLAAIYDLRDIVIALVQESGQDISSGDVQGNTPLLHASKAGNSYLVEQLLEHLDEPGMNKQNNRGETPLMVAAMNGHCQVVDTLLRKKGTNVEARDNSGRTALSWASHYGREPVVSQLIDKGQATVTTWASDNLTPLARASAQGHLETVRLLLNTTITDKTNKQIPKAINGAFSKACEKGQIHIVRLFITNAKNQLIKNWCDKMTRCSPLWLATKNKHYEIARLLVKEIEADVRSPDIHGISPMFLAWQSNNLDLLSFFLCNGTQVSQRWPILESIMRRHRNEELAELVFQSNDIEIDLNSEAKGATPLTWAMENDYERLAQILINDSRTDINLKDKELRCPLLVATEKTNERLTMTLIQKEQIEANATNREGSTPLMVALKNSSRTIASILICSGKASLLVQDKEGRTLLHLAAQTDLEDAVRLLLQRESMKLNAQDHDGMTALHIAAKSGFEGIVKLLLPEQDIELAARNQKGLSPLELAIESGHKHITRLLVNSKRLDLTIQDERGRSLLSRAIERGRKDIAGQILEHDYEIVNIKAHDGRNALHVALDKGRKDIVNMLIRDSRASLEKMLSSRDAKNRTPLHAAVGSGRKGIVSLITDYCLKTHFRAHDINGNTALHIAVKEGREDLVEVLIRPLEAKVSLTERDNRGLTPLSMAVVQKDIEIIQLILNHVEKNGFSLGANMKDHKGFSPLARAISQNSIDIIKMLSKSTSVNPNWKTKHGYNALSLAVIRKRRLEVKESLVENGAMLNSQDARGRTPLMHAVMKSKKWGKLFPVRDLLKLKDKNGEGIDMNVRDEAGHTALIMAVRLDDVGLVKTLLQHKDLDPNVCCNRRRTALSYACAKGQRLMVELLISHHDEYGSIALEVNLHDTNGFTPFAYAARYRRLRIMKILLDRFDVELDCQDEKGRTPLMYAAKQGSMAIVQHLLTFSLPQPSSVSSPSSLQSRIDINKQDVKGMTPLMHAVKHGKTKTVGILINNSADIGIVAKDGKTALALATEKGYRKIAAILRNRTPNFQGRDFERGVSVRQRGRRT